MQQVSETMPMINDQFFYNVVINPNPTNSKRLHNKLPSYLERAHELKMQFKVVYGTWCFVIGGNSNGTKAKKMGNQYPNSFMVQKS